MFRFGEKGITTMKRGDYFAVIERFNGEALQHVILGECKGWVTFTINFGLASLYNVWLCPPKPLPAIVIHRIWPLAPVLFLLQRD